MEDHGLLDFKHENQDGQASASSAGAPAPVSQPPAAGEPVTSSAGVLAPVPQPAAAAAAVALAAVRPPRSSGPGGWQVVLVPGGWLKFSQTLGRLDAHCSRHGGGCKMDRNLRKGRRRRRPILISIQISQPGMSFRRWLGNISLL